MFTHKKTFMFMLRAKQGGHLWNKFKVISRRISSTEMSSVVDCNPKTTRERLWKEKLGKIARRDVSKLAPVVHGRVMEPIAREWIAWEMRHEWDLKTPQMLLDPDIPVCCSPDGVFYHKKNKLVKGLEIKCPFILKNMPQSKEAIHLEYLIQCFVCLHVCKADSWLLIFFFEDTRDQRSIQLDPTPVGYLAPVREASLVAFELFPDEHLWTSFFAREVAQFQKELQGNSLHPHPRKEKMERKNWVREKLLALTVPFIL